MCHNEQPVAASEQGCMCEGHKSSYIFHLVDVRIDVVSAQIDQFPLRPRLTTSWRLIGGTHWFPVVSSHKNTRIQVQDATAGWHIWPLYNLEERKCTDEELMSERKWKTTPAAATIVFLCVCVLWFIISRGSRQRPWCQEDTLCKCATAWRWGSVMLEGRLVKPSQQRHGPVCTGRGGTLLLWSWRQHGLLGAAPSAPGAGMLTDRHK